MTTTSSTAAGRPTALGTAAVVVTASAIDASVSDIAADVFVTASDTDVGVSDIVAAVFVTVSGTDAYVSDIAAAVFVTAGVSDIAADSGFFFLLQLFMLVFFLIFILLLFLLLLQLQMLVFPVLLVLLLLSPRIITAVASVTAETGTIVIYGTTVAAAVMLLSPRLLFLFRFCVCFCLYGPFNCISLHEFSRQLSAFSLCY